VGSKQKFIVHDEKGACHPAETLDLKAVRSLNARASFSLLLSATPPQSQAQRPPIFAVGGP
jgi:hypothetical protein